MRRHFLSLLACVSLSACDKSPITWGESSQRPVDSNILQTDGNFAPDSALPNVSAFVLPSPACLSSLRYVQLGTRIDAVYWSARADSTTRLEFARSSDGGQHWDLHSVIDSTDVGRAGCAQSSPAIAVDSSMHYVHVSYAMQAREGPGIFFAHSMDDGALFHSPVPIMYGERLGKTAIASSGEHVVVAFEDPNGSRQRIGLALSRTMGHIFEDRIADVSGTEGSATDPMVAIARQKVRIAWRERTTRQAAPVMRVRTGILH